MTLSGTISSSAPSMCGRLNMARASSRVIHGPPTADWMTCARSSKLPWSFTERSNST